MVDEIAQIIARNAKPEKAIYIISLFLIWLLFWDVLGVALGTKLHLFNRLDVFVTLKGPKVSFEYVKNVYIVSNFLHPINAVWLTSGSSVPWYWMHSSLEQFENAESWIFEMLDKIIIDFNSWHSSNDPDEITFNWGGNLISVNLTQFENVLSFIIWSFVFSKFETNFSSRQDENALFPICSTEEGIVIDFNSLQ